VPIDEFGTTVGAGATADSVGLYTIRVEVGSFGFQITAAIDAAAWKKVSLEAVGYNLIQ
jgi:hypothetical protein